LDGCDVFYVINSGLFDASNGPEPT